VNHTESKDYRSTPNIWEKQHPESFLAGIESRLKHDPVFSNFADLVAARKAKILAAYPDLACGNLASLFEHPQAIEFIRHQPIVEIPELWHGIEIAAIELFGSLPACWAAYERFLILQRNQGTPLSVSQSLPTDEQCYQSEIVHRIEADSRQFLTLHCSAPLTLSDAIALINLDVFIIEQKWYEMLFSLQLSQRGSHFLLYFVSLDTYPVLVSSALIQHWHERQHWLSFDPFFQGMKWFPCQIPDIGKHLYQTGVLHDTVNLQPITCYDEASFSEYIKNPDAICELLRLTVSGSKNFRFFLLYFCQKQLANTLVKYGKKLSFTIIEEPIMLRFYQNLDRICYLNQSFCDINQDNIVTFKGFWLNEAMATELNNFNYSRYKSLVIGQRNKRRGENSVV
jgi:acyl homoserine lactone synthase